MRSPWLIIVNPHAGSDRAGRVWDKIERMLKESDVAFSHLLTGYPGHAAEIAEQAASEGWQKIAAAGGDGTLNEVVNGIMRKKTKNSSRIITGLIQIGTGNDWARSLGLDGGLHVAISALKSGKTRKQDVGYVCHGKHRRYFVNMAGFGFDADVARRTNIAKERGRGGKLSYLFNLAVALMAYKTKETKIKIDGKYVNGKFFSMNFGMGKYNGNGMMQLPHALLDNGLLDYSLYGNLKKTEVLCNIKKLYEGRLGGHPKVEHGSAASVRIWGNPAIMCECDGEFAGRGPCNLGVEPAVLNIAVP